MRRKYYGFSSEKHIFDDLKKRVAVWRKYHTAEPLPARFRHTYSLLGNMEISEYLEILKVMDPSSTDTSGICEYLEACDCDDSRLDALALHLATKS